MRRWFSLLLLASLLLPATTRADVVPQYLGSIYFGHGRRAGQIVQTPDGTIFAALQDMGSVASFNESGAYTDTWLGGLDQPTGLAFDDSLNLYVCEQHAHQVRKYDRFHQLVQTWGGFGTQPGQLQYPTNLAFSPDFSKLYVTELLGGRVSVFGRDGTFLFAFGTQGGGAGQLNYPFGIVVDPPTGDVFVANELNNRVDRFSATGVFVSSFGAPGTALGQFNLPVGLGRDPFSGDLYVTDQLNNRIQKFRSDGTPVLAWGNASTFYNPWEVTVTQMGNLWISDTYNYRIAIYGQPGATATPNTTWGALKSRYR